MYEVEGKEYRKIEIKRSHNTLFLSISYEDGKARNIVSNDANKATTTLLIKYGTDEEKHVERYFRSIEVGKRTGGDLKSYMLGLNATRNIQYTGKSKRKIIKIDIAYTILLKILLGILKFGEGNGVLLLFMSSRIRSAGITEIAPKSAAANSPPEKLTKRKISSYTKRGKVVEAKPGPP
jgi:hypothetical protein